MQSLTLASERISSIQKHPADVLDKPAWQLRIRFFMGRTRASIWHRLKFKRDRERRSAKVLFNATTIQLFFRTAASNATNVFCKRISIKSLGRRGRAVKTAKQKNIVFGRQSWRKTAGNLPVLAHEFPSSFKKEPS